MNRRFRPVTDLSIVDLTFCAVPVALLIAAWLYYAEYRADPIGLSETVIEKNSGCLIDTGRKVDRCTS